MKTITTIKELREELKNHRKEGRTIGLVPTMGFLHSGHISLVERSTQECDITVVSIFVNPTQFGPNEDFDSYPRDLESDKRQLEIAGASYVFAPAVDEVYSQNDGTAIRLEDPITRKLCGASRPGHFDGVTTVVSKLFNMVMPDRAYFGKKDAQQLAIVKRITDDLKYDIEIVGCEIKREQDGLAMSSRNVYLSSSERQAAAAISRAIFKAKAAIDTSQRDEILSAHIIEGIHSEIEGSGGRIDYIKIVDPDNFEDIKLIKGGYLILVATFYGRTRLIDNISGKLAAKSQENQC